MATSYFSPSRKLISSKSHTIMTETSRHSPIKASINLDDSDDESADLSKENGRTDENVPFQSKRVSPEKMVDRTFLSAIKGRTKLLKQLEK